jgi:uncharacterized protein involved in exopolysaccharide biosynthesis
MGRFLFTQGPVVGADGRPKETWRALIGRLRGDDPEQPASPEKWEKAVNELLNDSEVRGLLLRPDVHDELSRLGYDIGDSIRGEIQANVIKDTDLIAVSAEALQPEAARVIVEACMGAYIQQSQDRAQEQIRAASKYIETQLVGTGEPDSQYGLGGRKRQSLRD